MTISELILLILLFTKHWYIDFVNQTYEEIISKKTYGELLGLYHSIKHGVGSFIAILWFSPYAAFTIFVVETLIHYHIDWVKMNYGNNDQNSKIFWSHFGLDQLAHALTYIIIVWIVL